MSGEEANLPEVKVGAELTESGFSASAKSRAVAALDRLVGDLIDVPRTSIAAFNQRRKARADVREAMIRRAGEKAIGKIETDEQAIDLVVDRMLNEELRKQENKERVAELAMEDLREDPPKEEDGFNEEEFTDWMNVFSRYAEDASSERLRELWAKVLAGQIKKNRAFSFGTLRLLSELDPKLAKDFQDVISYRFEDIAIVTNQNMQGAELIKWTSLEDAGLLSSYFGMTLNKEVGDNGEFIFIQEQHAIIGRAAPNTKIQIPIKKLTKSGQEIASILPKPDGYQALDMLISVSSLENHSSELRIARIVELLENQIRSIPIKIIKPIQN